MKGSNVPFIPGMVTNIRRIAQNNAIFIANLAFPGDAFHIISSKMAIVLASLVAGIAGFIYLRIWGGMLPTDMDPDTMDFESELEEPN